MSTDTPRTDAMVTGNSDPCRDEYENLADFTRQLERECAKWERTADAYFIGNGHLQDKLADLTLQASQARDLLTEQLQDSPSGRDWNQVFAARQILKLALHESTHDRD